MEETVEEKPHWLNSRKISYFYHDIALPQQIDIYGNFKIYLNI